MDELQKTEDYQRYRKACNKIFITGGTSLTLAIVILLYNLLFLIPQNIAEQLVATMITISEIVILVSGTKIMHDLYLKSNTLPQFIIKGEAEIQYRYRYIVEESNGKE